MAPLLSEEAPTRLCCLNSLSQSCSTSLALFSSHMGLLAHTHMTSLCSSPDTWVAFSLTFFSLFKDPLSVRCSLLNSSKTARTSHFLSSHAASFSFRALKYIQIFYVLLYCLTPNEDISFIRTVIWFC